MVKRKVNTDIWWMVFTFLWLFYLIKILQIYSFIVYDFWMMKEDKWNFRVVYYAKYNLPLLYLCVMRVKIQLAFWVYFHQTRCILFSAFYQEIMSLPFSFTYNIIIQLYVRSHLVTKTHYFSYWVPYPLETVICT